MKQFEQLYMDKFGILQGLKCSMICVLHTTFILSELPCSDRLSLHKIFPRSSV
jgi:hypothetical protein